MGGQDAFLKIGLGAVTLVVLCLALACILTTSLFAQGAPEYPYYGKWCGGPEYAYTCLLVTQQAGPVVQISFAGSDGYTICTDVHPGQTIRNFMRSAAT